MLFYIYITYIFQFMINFSYDTYFTFTDTTNKKIKYLKKSLI